MSRRALCVIHKVIVALSLAMTILMTLAAMAARG